MTSNLDVKVTVNCSTSSVSKIELQLQYQTRLIGRRVGYDLLNGAVCQCRWMTTDPDFKDTPLFDVECLRNSIWDRYTVTARFQIYHSYPSYYRNSFRTSYNIISPVTMPCRSFNLHTDNFTVPRRLLSRFSTTSCWRRTRDKYLLWCTLLRWLNFSAIFYTILYIRHLGRTMQTFTMIGPRESFRRGR